MNKEKKEKFIKSVIDFINKEEIYSYRLNEYVNNDDDTVSVFVCDSSSEFDRPELGDGYWKVVCSFNINEKEWATITRQELFEKALEVRLKNLVDYYL